MDESAILSMITYHLGISILPEMLLDSIPQELRAIPFQVDSYRSIGLATRYHLSPAAKNLLKQRKHGCKIRTSKRLFIKQNRLIHKTLRN